MADTIGTYLWKGSDNKTIEQVQKYWTDNVNTTQFWTGDPRKIGTAEFFETVSAFIKKNYPHRYQLIEKEAAKYPGGTVLEVGCGAGWELLHWARCGMRPTGLDLSAAALELAQKNFEHNKLEADFKHGSAEELPFDDNSFNVVASLGVLHQTESTQQAVSEVYRILKPGGEAVITLYYKYSWKIFLTKLGKVNFEFSHEDAPITRLYDKQNLRELFAAFKNVDIFLDYIKATTTPRHGFLAGLFNLVFVPAYNLLPTFIRKHFGHAICVVAQK
ncbi:class I SAM-dependent methyltransferase [candidate division KSB1 bacterium]|nr:class I SAM-dependent methyltransferase [candidate division KSB1 bacterium]RQV99896.1 MAG: class I SAM-dependent methyltransferase [candidate division KSB1 bacterium]